MTAVPPDLGRIAYETWQRERGVPGDAHWDVMPPAAQAAWRTTAQVIAAAERERIYAQLGNDHYHAAIALTADEYDPDQLGRWRIDDIDDEGLPSLTRTAPEEAPDAS